MKKRHLRVVEAQSKKIGFINWVKNLLKKRGEKLTKVKELFLEKYYSKKYERTDKETVEIPYFLKARQRVKQIKELGQVNRYYKGIKRGLVC